MRIRIALMASLLLLALLLVGCDGKSEEPAASENASAEAKDEPTEDSQTEAKDEPIPENATVISVEEGCRIIYADGYFDEASFIYGELMMIDPDAYDQIGYYTMLKSDREYAPDGKLEILIGMTGREATEKASESLETYLDYTVSVIDGSIAINSYSAAGLGEAVKHFLSCVRLMGDKVVYIPSEDENIGKHTDYPAASVNIAGVSLSEFSFIYPKDASDAELAAIEMMIDWIGVNTGAVVDMRDDDTEKGKYEILMGRTSREASEQIYSTLESNEYIFKLLVSENEVTALIAYANILTMNSIVEKISADVSSTGKVPEEIKGEIEEDKMIVSKIEQLRDPCILLENGVYYAYGTGWVCYRNNSGDLAGDWEPLGRVVTVPEDAIDCYWAPEVHKYNGAFYMFTTYKSEKTGHRGCTVLRSDSPVGPFVEISDGHVTPSDWDAIDGTLYIDEEGTPWMIFVHEWTSTDDGIGRMAAAKMSDDLTKLISEPIELFRADDPSWTDRQVTDGCWLYKCENGELIMIWSNFSREGYCVGIARSDNGKVDGNWSQDDELLYSKSMTGEYDGGHGMIFYSITGQMYLSIHSPNSAGDGRKETPVFIAIREENGTLVWDI